MRTATERNGTASRPAFPLHGVRFLMANVAMFLLIGCRGDAGVPGALAIREGTVMTTDGYRLHYRMVGSEGDTVVVPLTYWNQAAFESLATRHTFLFFDPRGRRHSDPVPATSEFSIETDLTDLETVRTTFGISRMALIGTSYYGGVVARYAMLHPDRVSRLVLVGALYPRRTPFITFDPPDAAQRVNPLDVALLDSLKAAGADTADPAGYCRAYWRVEGPRTTGDPAAAASRTYPCDLANEWPANLERWGQGVFASLGDWDWTADAGAAVMPALIVHGTRDLMVPMASAEEWARVLPRASLFPIAGAGHVPWWEYEDVLFPALDSFLIGQR